MIVKLSSLGDIIHTYPSSSFLKERFPDAKITWLVEKRFEWAVKPLPHIQRVLSIDLKKMRKQLFSKETWKDFFALAGDLRKESFDLIFDFQGNCKSGLFTKLAKGKEKIGFDFATCREWPNALSTTRRYRIDKDLPPIERSLLLLKEHLGSKKDEIYATYLAPEQVEIEKIDLLTSKMKKPLVLLCPHSAWDQKKYSVDRWIETFSALQEEIPFELIVIYGSEKEKIESESICETLDFAKAIGELSIAGLQYLMRKASLVIGVDSGALHLAASALIPTFSLFGPTSQNIYQPKGSLHSSIQGKCPFDRLFERRCSHVKGCKESPCMKMLDPKQVVEELKKILMSAAL